MDPILPILLAITLFVLTAGAISALLYLYRISKDVRLVQQLLVAYMKKTSRAPLRITSSHRL